MKKEKIIKSAERLFEMYGYKKVSMNEIADEAGVTKKTIYAYFKDKDELLKSIVIQEVQSIKKIIENIEMKKLSFFDTINQALYEIFKYKSQNKLLVKIATESEKVKNKSTIEALKILDLSIKEYIKSKIIYAIEKKHIRKVDIDIATFLIYKMYIALIFEWDHTEKTLDEKQIADNLCMILKKGLLI